MIHDSAALDREREIEKGRWLHLCCFPKLGGDKASETVCVNKTRQLFFSVSFFCCIYAMLLLSVDFSSAFVRHGN